MLQPTLQINVEQTSQSIVKSISKSNVGLTSETDVKPTELSYVETT